MLGHSSRCSVPSLAAGESDPPRHLHSFPTRRSSDLQSSSAAPPRPDGNCPSLLGSGYGSDRCPGLGRQDRKSTRLNSSHVASSYAVFCLKKKTIQVQYFNRPVAVDRDPVGRRPKSRL